VKANRLTPLLVLLIGGCGYSFGSQIPDEIKTVRVDVAGRWPLRARGIEFELTRAVVNEIRTKTSCEIMRDDADAIVEIDITHYKTGAVSAQLNKVVDANLLIRAHVKITARKPVDESGRKLLFDGTVEELEPYTPSGGDSEITARHRAVKKLARKILNRLAFW
jgi:hypothetical protein